MYIRIDKLYVRSEVSVIVPPVEISTKNGPVNDESMDTTKLPWPPTARSNVRT